MEKIFTSAEMKTIEQMSDRAGITYLRLMENAGSAAYNVLRKQYGITSGKMVVLCGNGNNGGDGFVVARKFFDNGVDCAVVLVSGAPKTPEAVSMYNRVCERDINVIDFEIEPKSAYLAISQCDVVVDAVYGTGFHGKLKSNIKELFTFVNNVGKKTFSLDVPSGMNANDVCVEEVCIQPMGTIVFAAYKPAHKLGETEVLCGELTLVDIGIDKTFYESVPLSINVMDEAFTSGLLKKRSPFGNKGTFGKLLTVCGSFGMSGAAGMSTMAAMRSGAGLVTLATTERLAEAFIPTLLECTMLPLKEGENGNISAENAEKILEAAEKYTALLIGCGMGNNLDTKEIVEALIKISGKTIVIDADGINVLCESINILKESKADIILTPHIGEFARLLGTSIEEVKKRRFGLAREFATENNVTLVLKDSTTLIATPDSRLLINCNSNSGLAKGGSGDVLAGIIASLCAQGYTPRNASALGVYVHMTAASITAARMSEHGMLARDVIDDIAFAFKIMENKG